MSAAGSGNRATRQLTGGRGALQRIGDAIASTSMTLAGAAMAAIVVINGANVAGRYFLSTPIAWAEEAMLYLMIVVVFSAVAAVTWRGAHIRIELLVEQFPPPMRMAAALLTAALTTGIAVAVAFSSFDVVSQLYAFDQRSDAMEMPVWIAQSAVLLGLFLIAAMTVLRLIVFGPLATGASEIQDYV